VALAQNDGQDQREGRWRRDGGQQQDGGDRGQAQARQPQVQQQTQNANDGQRRGGAWQGSGQAPAQNAGQSSSRNADWGAYYRANPDLQREYEANRQNYQRNGESTDAYAQRHYREHGQSEGRALPQTSGGGDRNGGRDWNNSGDRNNGRDWNNGGDRNNGRDWNNGRNDRGDRGDRNSGRDWNNGGNDRGGRDRSGDRGRNDNGRWNDRYGNGQWNGRSWQGRDYRRAYNAERRFRAGAYNRPNGWYYRRWTLGSILPSLFFSQNYWLDDYSAYGLPYPPPGAVWVRYGNDALLVDEWSGEVIQVIYGMFY
jgi:hypothetical protein